MIEHLTKQNDGQNSSAGEHEPKGTLLKYAFSLVVLAGLSILFAWETEEVVEYRLSREQTVILKDQETAQSYAQALKNLGCDYRLDSDAGRFSLTIHRSDWSDAKFGDHRVATRWRVWLKSLGFETEHQH